MDQNTIAIIQLFVGSGILLLILRIAVLMGSYTSRLEALENTSREQREKVSKIDRNVTILLTHSNLAEIRAKRHET
jgi:hypothetical protein